MQIVDSDGIAAPGEIIRNDDIYVYKQSPKNTRDTPTHDLKDKYVFAVSSKTKFPAFMSLKWFIFRISRDYTDTNAVFKGIEGETTVVDRVILCSDENNRLCIKFIIRGTRRPEVIIDTPSKNFVVVPVVHASI